MLSYEAAPAFDPVLAAHQASDFPLAWAAASQKHQSVTTESERNNQFELVGAARESR